MVKFYATIKDVKVEIDLERVIKVKALQAYYRLQQIDPNVSYKEIYKKIKQEMENIA